MTQAKNILEHMLREKDRQTWFYPPDFMRGGMQNFVGYEASARLSELASDYPDMIESRRRGKYMERRIRFETIPLWWPQLPEDYQQLFIAYDAKPEATVI